MTSVELPIKIISSVAQQVGYRRRKFRLVVCESVTLQDLNWSGGTRNEYHGVNLETNDVSSAPKINRPHPMNNESEGARVALRSGVAILRTGYFCGQVSMATLYVHPSNAPALIGVAK